MDVLHGMTRDKCLIYIDDILVFSQSFQDHIADLKAVFNCLEQTNLHLNPKKCIFATDQVNYLGHVITPTGVAPDTRNVHAVADFPIPWNVTQLKFFLGLSGFYRRFCAGYSHLTVPLTALLKHDIPYIWDIT